MAEAIDAPDIGPGTTPQSGKVGQVRQKWMVYEDGAFADKLQTEEFQQHYGLNRHHRRTVREDIPVARTAQDEEEFTQQQQRMQELQASAAQAEEDEHMAQVVTTQLMLQDETDRKRAEMSDAEYAKMIQEKEQRRYERYREKKRERELKKERERLEERLAQNSENARLTQSSTDGLDTHSSHSDDGMHSTVHVTPSGAIEDDGDFSDFYNLPPDGVNMDPVQRLRLQEHQDEELALLLQDHEHKRSGAEIDRSKIAEIEEGDAHLARVIQEQEKIRYMRRKQRSMEERARNTDNFHVPERSQSAGNHHRHQQHIASDHQRHQQNLADHHHHHLQQEVADNAVNHESASRPLPGEARVMVPSHLPASAQHITQQTQGSHLPSSAQQVTQQTHSSHTTTTTQHSVTTQSHQQRVEYDIQHRVERENLQRMIEQRKEPRNTDHIASQRMIERGSMELDAYHHELDQRDSDGHRGTRDGHREAQRNSYSDDLSHSHRDVTESRGVVQSSGETQQRGPVQSSGETRQPRETSQERLARSMATREQLPPPSSARQPYNIAMAIDPTYNRRHQQHQQQPQQQPQQQQQQQPQHQDNAANADAAQTNTSPTEYIEPSDNGYEIDEDGIWPVQGQRRSTFDKSIKKSQKKPEPTDKKSNCKQQ